MDAGAAQSNGTYDTGSLAALEAEDALLALWLKVAVPKVHQDAVLALLSLHLELARAHRIAREPNIGLIRLKWWQEAVEELYRGDRPRQHPVVLALGETVKGRVAPGLLSAMIESHQIDWDQTPSGGYDWHTAVSGFAGQWGNLFRAVLSVAGQDDSAAHAAANHLGVAFAVVRSVPGMGTANDLPRFSNAKDEPNWLVQALTHLDQAKETAGLWKPLGALEPLLRAQLMALTQDKLPRAVGLARAAAPGLWWRARF